MDPYDLERSAEAIEADDDDDDDDDGRGAEEADRSEVVGAPARVRRGGAMDDVARLDAARDAERAAAEAADRIAAAFISGGTLIDYIYI